MSGHVLQCGAIHVNLPFALPKGAGTLGSNERKRLSKPPAGLAHACHAAAYALESGGARAVSTEVSARQLREGAYKVEALERVLADLNVVTESLTEAMLLLRAEAYTQLRHLHADVKTAAQFNDSARDAFETVYEYFKKSRPIRNKRMEEQAESADAAAG